MRGEDCKNSWEMNELIDVFQERYSTDNKDIDYTLYRIDEFINEVRSEINEYGGDRKVRIQSYFIDCIQDMLRNIDSSELEKDEQPPSNE